MKGGYIVSLGFMFSADWLVAPVTSQETAICQQHWVEEVHTSYVNMIWVLVSKSAFQMLMKKEMQ